MKPDGGAELHIDLKAWLVDAIIVGAGRISPLLVVRDAGSLTDGYTHLSLLYPVDGWWEGEANGSPFSCGPGQILCIDATRPFSLAGSAGTCIFLIVPRDAFTRSLPKMPDIHGEVLRSGGARMLAAHLEALPDYVGKVRPEEATRIAEGTLALAGLALGELHETRIAQPDRSTRAPGLRQRVQRHIDQNLASPDLTPDAIARDLDIPRSSLYRAFSPLGGISRYIQVRRLDTASMLLLHPEEHRSVAELADTLGFDSPATFSKAFRRRFECSPREARRRGSASAASTRAIFERWRDVEAGDLMSSGARKPYASAVAAA